MSANPPPKDIDNLPLDVFAEGEGAQQATPAEATPAESNEASWAAAGLKPETDAETGLSRRMRRIYDAMVVVVLWGLLGLLFQGIVLRPRFFVALIVASILYTFIARHGTNRRRLHAYMDRMRRRVEAG